MMNKDEMICEACGGDGCTTEAWGDYAERTEGCTACYGSGKAQAWGGRMSDYDPERWPTFGLDEECGQAWPVGMRHVPSAVYHAHKAVSSSELKHALRSFAHYQAARGGELERENVGALTMGTAAHLAILEPERAAALLALKLDGRTTAGKDQQAANAAREAQGLEPLVLLGQSDLDAVRRMADAVWAHPAARGLLELGGEVETSWVGQVDGFPVRVRPDFLSYGGHIVDLKTCQDASPAGFARSAAHWSYHLQGALYCDALFGSHFPLETQGYSWIAVEKTAPYAVAVYTMGEDDAGLATYTAGQRAYKDAFDTLRRHLKDPKRWKGYSPDPQPLVLPKWA